MEYEVEGARPRGKTKKSWIEVVQKHYQAHKLIRIVVDGGKSDKDD